MNTFNISVNVNKANSNINVVITDNDSNIVVKDSFISTEVDKDELIEGYLDKNIPKYGEIIRKKYSIKGIIFFHV